MRRLIIMIVWAGLLVGLPSAAVAGGSGGGCPHGLTQKLVPPNFQGSPRYRYEPLKIEGFEARVHNVEKTDGVPRKNYVWGEGRRISGKTEYVVLCGKAIPIPSDANEPSVLVVLGVAFGALVSLGLLSLIAEAANKKDATTKRQ